MFYILFIVYRVAKTLILDAERSGLLKPGGLIVEATGGNTGVSLAAMGISKGYKVIVTMPNCISLEKVNFQKRFGAEVYLQPLVTIASPEYFTRKAESLAKEKNGIYLNQFENLSNFRAHFSSTGPEIWKQTNGKIDAFITSAGTGGTLAGTASYLKTVHPSIKCYLADPLGSVLFSYVKDRKMDCGEGSSQIEGIGIGRITANFSQCLDLLDGCLKCNDQEAIEMAYYLIRNEGLYVGPSASLNVVGAVKLAKSLGPGNTIVTILCDAGEKYESKIYNDEWLKKHSLIPNSIGNNIDFININEEIVKNKI